MYESDEEVLSVPISDMRSMRGIFSTPPAKYSCAPKREKKRKYHGKFDSAKKVFWWQPTPQDCNKEILLGKLEVLPIEMILKIFEFTDFWTLLAAESLETLPQVQLAAKKEIKNRLKF